MSILTYILISSLSISIIAFVGILFLSFRKELLEKILLLLISLSAGTLMGGAFLHLMPEASEQLSGETLFGLILVSFCFFYLIEKLLHWRHCHKQDCEIHSFGYMSLVGDAIHNFIDGLIIAATFLVDIKLGITTTIAIAFHEVPQEIGDFGVLIYAGFKKNKALALNFLIALTVVVGGLTGYLLSFNLEGLIIYLLPIAAGGFIYIATSDLIPEIRKEKDISRSLFSFLLFLVGIAIMYLIKFILH